MRVCGIICEYNPFHRGHMLHISRAREESGADFVVCAMSGPVTQRGTFARHDKWTRARAALMGGADLVLELPVRFACASAQEFAAGGVALLSGLGVVTHLSFGCEADTLPLLRPAACALGSESPEFAGALRARLARGLSYPRARAEAAEQASGIPGLAQAISLPNAALALEYLRTLPPHIAPVPIARMGSGYHDESLSELSSATAVRAALARGDAGAAFDALPFPDPFAQAEADGDVHGEEALTQALLYRLRTTDASSLSQLAGMDEGLEHRFLAAACHAHTREALIAAVKSRRYTWTRLSRLCTGILLQIDRGFAGAHRAPTYARILGFRRSSSPLLHEVKQTSALPLITKAADFDRSDPLFLLDTRAQDLWALGCASPERRTSGRDFVTGPVIL